MNNLAHADGQVTENLSVVYAKKILDRDETVSDQMASNEASYDLHLLMAAGLPTDTIELLAALKAAGDGKEEIEISDRQLINFILPGCGKTADVKMARLKYMRQKLQKALGNKDTHPLIEIAPGGGRIVDGRQETYPTRYRLPIVRHRRELIRALPEDASPGAIEEAAKAVIQKAYGKAIPRKHVGRRPLKDMSASTHMRMSVARLEKVIRTDNATQVINDALEQAPKVKLALCRAFGITTRTEKLDILSEFQRFESAFQPFYEAVGQLTDDSLTEAANGISNLLEFIHARLTESPNSQVVDSIEAEEGLNFIPPPSIEEPELAPSHPLLLRVEGEEPPSVNLPEVRGQEATREEIEELSLLGQAMDALAVFPSPKKIFLRLAKGGDTLKSAHLEPRAAVEALPEWLAKSDELQASLMFRPMYAPPRNKMTAAEKAADDAIVRPRAIHDDDIKGVEKFEARRPWGSLGFETSPDNFQMVILVMADAETTKNIKRRWVKKQDSDKGASGSYRTAGSRNWKPERGGCLIQLRHLAYNRIWAPAEIEASGLLAPPEPPSVSRPIPERQEGRPPTRWPIYHYCIDGAPRKKDGKTPDYSSIDATWVKTCRKWGFERAAIESELWNLRDAFDGKPSRQPDYVKDTIDYAFS